MSAGAQVDWFAQNAPAASSGGQGDWFASNAPGAGLTENPHGEGIYKMVGPQGQTLAVPFSKVRGAEDLKFQVAPADAPRYQKDAAATQDTRSPLQKSFDENTQTRSSEPLLETGLKSVVHAIGSPVVHPVETVQSMAGTGASPSPAAKMISDAAQSTYGDYKDGGAAYAATKAGGNLFGQVALGEAGGTVLKGARAIPDAVVQPFLKAVGGDSLDTPIKGDSVTPRQLYQTAQDMGVNFDTAQATGSAAATAAKKATEHSLLGASKFAANNAANESALHVAADKLLELAHPDAQSLEGFGNNLQDLLAQHRDVLKQQAGLPEAAQSILDQTVPEQISREKFGAAAQSALRQHQQLLSDEAGNIFQGLDERAGSQVPDTSAVRWQAGKILQDNASFFKNHPELLTGGNGKAWGVVKNLADTSNEAPRIDTWSDLHKLRSNLMNLYRSPDIVGTEAEGWLKQMAGSVDKSMTGASSGLSPEDLTQFRNANDIYSYMKGTYDDPRSPLYHVLRAPDALTAANTLAKASPTVARNVMKAATDLQAPELTQHLQAQAISRLFDPAGNGVFDLEGFPSRFERAQKEHLAGTLNPSQMGSLQDLAAKASEEGPYDNARSDAAKILNAKDGVEAAGQALKAGPDGLRQIQAAAKLLGASDVIPQLQRQKIASILSPAANEISDLRNLPTRFNNVPKEQLDQLLSPEQVQKLQDLARVSKIVHVDSNPAGTAKIIQAKDELGSYVTGLSAAGTGGAMGHPLTAVGAAVLPAAYSAVKGAVARAMTRPSFTEAAMEAGAKGTGAVASPGLTATGAAGAAGTTAASEAQGQRATWQKQGAENLTTHLQGDSSSGVKAADVEALASTSAGRDLLMRASGVKPGSAAMKSLAGQAKRMLSPVQ